MIKSLKWRQGEEEVFVQNMPDKLAESKKRLWVQEALEAADGDLYIVGCVS